MTRSALHPSIYQDSVEKFLGGSNVEAEPELQKLNEMLA